MQMTGIHSVRNLVFGSAFLLAALLAGPAGGQQAGSADAEAAELAKKLSNPIASLISVPIKWSYDTGFGPADADRNTLIVQPVIPFSLNDDWNLITRTIIPYVDMESPVSGGDGESGLADVLASFFFSPKAATASGWVWGAGPAISVPTATEDVLGSEKWAAGPTVVLLKQQSGWTYGLLANHLWSVAGDDDRSHTSATFVQPFLSFTTPKRTTWGINTESTYDWPSGEWTSPVNASVSQLLKLGGKPVSMAFALRGYAVRPPGGPDWGASLTFTLLYPK